MKKSFLCLAVFLFFGTKLSTQTVYLPATHEVYKFLDAMAAKQIIIGYRDAVKPLSRQSIAKFLIQIDSLKTQLTTVEQEQLKFYKEEFYEEMKNLNYQNLSDERGIFTIIKVSQRNLWLTLSVQRRMIIWQMEKLSQNLQTELPLTDMWGVTSAHIFTIMILTTAVHTSIL